MNRTVPWSIKGVGPDTREAAKEAARRSGVSLGEWLDGVIAERAASLGVPPAAIDNKERLEAVAVELSRLAGGFPQPMDAGEIEREAGSPEANDSNADSAPAETEGEMTGASAVSRNVPDRDRRDFGPGGVAFRGASGPRGESAVPVAQVLRGRTRIDGRVLGAVNGSLAQTLDFEDQESGPTETALRLLSEKLAKFEKLDWASAKPGGLGPSGAQPVRNPVPTPPPPFKAIRERSIREAVAEIIRRQAALDSDEAAAGARRAADRGAEPSDPAEGASATARDESEEVLAGPDCGGTPRNPSGLEARLASGRTGAAARERAASSEPPASGSESAASASNAADLEGSSVSATRGSAEANLAPSPAKSARSLVGRSRRELRDRPVVRREALPEADEVKAAAIEAGLQPLAQVQSRSRTKADGTLGEIRALLDRFEPGSTISSLERLMEDLAARIDVGPQLSAKQIEELARQVDEIHTSIQGRKDTSPLEAKSIERLMGGIAERIEQARGASADIGHLEGLIKDLTAKIEDGSAQPDQMSVNALGVQINRLGERLERSEASLSVLDGVERSLGELFGQLEATQRATIDAAENAARKAARDAVRAVVETSPGSSGPRNFEGGLVDQVTQELSELRVTHDASSRRTQATLASLQQTMEKLVDQLARLDVAGRGPGDVAPAAEAASVAPDSEASEKRRLGGAPSVRAEPPLQDRARPGEVEPVDPLDTLIEPGSGRAPIRDRAGKPEGGARGTAGAVALPTGDGEGPASFIAAARRAAHAAQASAAAAQRPAGRLRTSDDSKPATALSSLERARNFLVQRRRPILLSLAGLVLLLGALEVARLGSLGSAPSQKTGAAGTVAPAFVAGEGESRSSQAAAKPADTGNDSGQAGRKTSAASLEGSPGAAPAAAPAPNKSAQAGSSSAGGPASVGTVKSGSAARNLNPFLSASGFGASGIGEGLRSLALSGDPAAQYEVGLRFAEGRTVGRDVKMAAIWFEKAAAQGLAPAQYRLGSAYEKGIGEPRDAALAINWYGRAAEAGNMRAMHNLAVMAAEGSVGKPDYAKAATWFAKAAALGVRDSQYNLAILCARGLGTEQSLEKSYTWFAVAASQGDDDAAKKRDEVAARLDPKTLASAKAAAEAFRPETAISAANEVAPPPGGWDAAAPARPAPSASKATTSPKVSVM